MIKVSFICSYFLREGKGRRKREKHQYVVASRMPPTGDLAHNPGMCPRLGIQGAILLFSGQPSIHSATPARAIKVYFGNIRIVQY